MSHAMTVLHWLGGFVIVGGGLAIAFFLLPRYQSPYGTASTNPAPARTVEELRRAGLVGEPSPHDIDD